MPCYSPLNGFYSKSLNLNGKRNIVFTTREALDDRTINVPCGQCIGCKLERSRQWAIRCLHEASLYEKNCFLTLTYRDFHLPVDKSLDKTHFQKFIKRLRKAYPHSKIRYFQCGEYGEKFQRPHYHAIIFNHDFNDKKPLKIINENVIYKSRQLNKLWKLGHCSIGEVTFESAAYVARYVTKKITGDLAFYHYNHFDADGEISLELSPEYVTMSRRPGIGKPWLEKYTKDVYPDDFVVIRGKKLKPPKYYDKLLNDLNPFVSDEIKERRETNGKKSENFSPRRLADREFIQLSKLKTLKRTYENDS